MLPRPHTAAFLLKLYCCVLFICLSGALIKRVPRSEHEKFVAQYGNDTAVVRHGRTVYLLSGRTDGHMSQKKHTFPDRYTFNAFGLEFKHAHEKSRDVINSYKNGPAIPSLRDHHANEAMLAMFKSGFLRNTTKVFDALNLNYVYFDHYVVLTWRVNEQKFALVALPRKSYVDPFGKGSKPELRSDMEKLKKHRKMDYHIGEDVSEIPGEDPRLFVHENRLFVTFATRYRRGKPEIRMTIQEIFLAVRNSGSIHELELKKPIFDIEFDKEKEKDQKNWTPFTDSKGELRFVQSIEPFCVVKLDMVIPCCGDEAIGVAKTGRSIAKATVVSTGAKGLTKKGGSFPFGELRGGTSALLVPTDYPGGKSYLAFFHASNEPMEGLGLPVRYTDVLKTYVMGAYLFSAKEPYELQAISRHPITHQSMYSGKWPDLPWAYYHMDYIIFPTNYLFEEETGTIFLQYGHQDRETWVAELSLSGLLKSLIPVKG